MVASLSACAITYHHGNYIVMANAMTTGSRVRCPNCRGGYINPEREDRAECPVCEVWEWVALPLSPDALEALGVAYAWECELVADEYAEGALGITEAA